MSRIEKTLNNALDEALTRRFINEFKSSATVVGEMNQQPINIALQGMTGIGKTAITRQWAEDHSDEINFVEFSSNSLSVNEAEGKRIIFPESAIVQMEKPGTVLFFDDYHLIDPEVGEELNKLLDHRQVETVNDTVTLDNILFVVVAITI